MELLATGRMAEVYAYDEGRVLKLDRPEWNGIAALEIDILRRMAGVGVPVPRADEVVTVHGRSGIVMERVGGRPLLEILPTATPAEAAAAAERFVDLQARLVGTEMEGLPELVPRLANELAVGGLPPSLQDELTTLLLDLDDQRQCVCHFDLHPGNVLVGPQGWVVIDWLAVGAGPPVADVVRTLLTLGQASGTPDAFVEALWHKGLTRHDIDDDISRAWVRVLAGARLAEGFEGADAAWLREVAAGARRVGPDALRG
jgi:aminoglycoside phosphotransferase (APT) family kinase protein